MNYLYLKLFFSLYDYVHVSLLIFFFFLVILISFDALELLFLLFPLVSTEKDSR